MGVELSTIIKVDSSAAKDSLKSLSQEAKATGDAGTHMGKAFEEAAKTQADAADKLIKTLGIAAAALKAYQLVMAAVASAQKDMMAQAKLEGVIRATGAVSGITAKQMAALNKEITANSIYASGAVTDAQALMATFSAIGSDVFPRAMQAATDMAAVTGSLDGAVMMLGKALQDPIEGLGGLARVGFTFTDEQKKMTEAMVKTGKAAEAQAYILSQLEQSQKGVAKAQADTAAGALIKLKNQYDSLTASMGEKLIPALVLFQRVTNAIIGLIGGNLDIIIAALIVAFVAMAPAIWATTTALWAKVAALVAAKVAVLGLNAAMFANPLFLAAAAIVAGIAGVAIALGRMGKAAKDATGAMGELGDATNDTRPKVEDGFTKAMKSAQKLIDKLNENNKPKYLNDLKDISTATNEEIAALKKRLDSIGDIPVIRLANPLTGKGKGIDEREALEAKITELTKAANDARSKILIDAFKSQNDAYKKALKDMAMAGMTEHEKELAELKDTLDERLKLFKKNNAAQEQARKLYTKQAAEIDAKYEAEAKEARAAAVAGMLSPMEKLTAERRKQIEQQIADVKAGNLTIAESQKLSAVQGAEHANAVRQAEEDRKKTIQELTGVMASAADKEVEDYNKRASALTAYFAVEKARAGENAAALAQLEAQEKSGAERLLAQHQAKIAAMTESEKAQRDALLLIGMEGTEKQLAAIGAAQAAELVKLQEGHKNKLLSAEEYEQKRTLIANNANKQRSDLALKTMQSEMAAMSGFMGGMSSMLSAAYGEQFALAKAFGIASATVNTVTAIASALATQPFMPAGLAAWGTALSATAGIVTQIKGATFQGAKDGGGTLGINDFALVGEKRPEIVTSPTLIRGPANITSGAETAALMGAMQARGDDDAEPATNDTFNLTLNVVSDTGDVSNQIKQAVRTGEFMPVFAELAQKAKAQGIL